jgi:multidrug transporter EmrE-like cation transporter
MWLILMLIILLANGMSSFGLKVLAAWGLPPAIKFPYLTIWYAAGLLSFGIPLLWRKERGGWKEAGWGALIALLSIGGQLAMANALNAGIAGSVVFPVTIGGSILIVALAGRFFFGERLSSVSWAGVAIGFVSIVLLSMS